MYLTTKQKKNTKQGLLFKAHKSSGFLVRRVTKSILKIIPLRPEKACSKCRHQLSGWMESRGVAPPDWMSSCPDFKLYSLKRKALLEGMIQDLGREEWELMSK